MISNSTLKISIMQKYKSLENTYTLQELIATEVLLYKYILNFIANNPSQENTINDLVSSYSTEFKLSFISLKNTVTSYQQIINFLQDIKATSLLMLKENDIDKIYNFYVNGKKIIPFDPSYFSEDMYNVSDITNDEYLFLSKVHYGIMTPIYEYFHDIYGINKENIKIVSANEVHGNAGKIIRFYIENVDIANAYSAIVNNHIPIHEYTCELEYPNIKLVIS